MTKEQFLLAVIILNFNNNNDNKNNKLNIYILFITGSFDATIRIWDCRSSNLQAIQIIEDCKDSIVSIQVKNTEIIAGCADGKLRIYDLRQGQLYEDYIGSKFSKINKYINKY